MRKLLLILCLLIQTAVYAGDLKVGVEATPFYDWMSVTENQAKGGWGYRTGVLTEYTFDFNMSFQTGVSFVKKTCEIYGSGLCGSELNRINFRQLYYVSVPFMIGYKIPLNKELSITPRFGGFVGKGVGGTTDVYGVITRGGVFGKFIDKPWPKPGTPYEENYPSFGLKFQGQHYCPPIDIDSGIRAELACQYKNLALALGCEHSMWNLTFYGGNTLMTTLELSMRYYFLNFGK